MDFQQNPEAKSMGLPDYAKPPSVKRCQRCGLAKLKKLFVLDMNEPDGRGAVCKKCKGDAR